MEYNLKFREDEEMEFYTDLVLHEIERWIQAVTKKSLQYPDDTRKSLENGVLLCELLNCLQPGSVNRINRLPTPIAGLDNINVFLQACKTKFGLSEVHLFNPSELEDLSQRAIAESAHLKQEYEKRLVNVAITIYWLGRYASGNYQGAQLDLSVFSALIHHQTGRAEQGHHVECAYMTGAASASYPGDLSPRTCRSTFGKPYTLEYPNESPEEGVSDVDSSITSSCYNSTLALQSHGQPHTSQQQSHIVFSSISDLTSKASSHRRYSSTDSLESSYCSGQSGHSRQGSEHQEVIYPTRRLNSQLIRKQSTSNDPLQFIKGKGAQNLAHTAEVQMRVASESKKGSILTQDSEENVDWQAELSSWKNRRKSQSERSYLAQDQLQQNDPGEDVSPVSRTKTFSQMQEERQLRMTSRQKLYPMKDDDNAQFPVVDKQQENGFSLMSTPKCQLNSDNEVSPDDRENDEVDGRHTGLNDYSSSSDSQGDTNNNFSSALKSHVNGDTWTPLYISQSNPWKLFTTSPVSDKVTNSNDGDSSSSTRKGVCKNGKRYLDVEGESSSTREEICIKYEGVTLAGKRQEFDSQITDIEKKSCPAQAALPLKFCRNVGSRMQTKIGSILQNLEDSKISLPKLGYNERVDFSARRSAFENVFEDNCVPSVSEGGIQTGTLSETVPSTAPSSAPSSATSTTLSAELTLASSPPTSTAPSTAPSSAPSSATSTTLSAELTLASSPPTSTAPSTAPSSQNDSSQKNTDKSYVRKTVRISQKPRSERGFGFVLSGGAGRQSALYISKVVLGSAADVCELKAGDVVMLINQTEVAAMTAVQVGEIVARAVDAGSIDVQVLREITQDDSEGFISSDDEEQEMVSSHEQETKLMQAQGYKGGNDGQLMQAQGYTDDHTSKLSESHKGNNEQCALEPPAILRKWQQQQHPTNDMKREDSNIYSSVNLRGLLPMHDSQVPIKDLSASQESSNGASHSFRGLLGASGQQEVQVEPRVIDKLLEERRAERRARLLQSTSLAQSPPTQSLLTEARQVNSQLDDPLPFVSSTISQGWPPTGLQTELHVSTRGSRHTLNEATAPGNFQLKQQPSLDPVASALIEEERQCINAEEIMKLKENIQRAEEEVKIKETKEKKRLQKEEEELKKQKEILRLEREKFLQEKEEFIRFQEELLRHQPHQPAPPDQQPSLHLDASSFQPISQVYKQTGFFSNGFYKSDSTKLIPSIIQPIAVHTRLEPAHNQTNIPAHNQTNLPAHNQTNLPAHNQTNLPAHNQTNLPAHNQTNLPAHNQTNLPAHNQTSLPSELSSKPQLDVLRFRSPTAGCIQAATRGDIQAATRGYIQAATRGDIQAATRGDIQAATRGDNESKRVDLRFYSDKILAKKGTAKPMQFSAAVSRDNFSQHLIAPIIRESPSKEEIHCLNSVPMAKFRSDTAWQSSPNPRHSLSPQQPLKNTAWQSSPNPQQPLKNTDWQSSPNPQHSLSPQQPLKNTDWQSSPNPQQPLKNTDWQSSPNPQQPLKNTDWQSSPNPQHSLSPQQPLKNTDWQSSPNPQQPLKNTAWQSSPNPQQPLKNTDWQSSPNPQQPLKNTDWQSSPNPQQPLKNTDWQSSPNPQQPLKNTDWQSSPNPQQPLKNTDWQSSPNPQHSLSPQQPLKNTDWQSSPNPQQPLKNTAWQSSPNPQQPLKNTDWQSSPNPQQPLKNTDWQSSPNPQQPLKNTDWQSSPNPQQPLKNTDWQSSPNPQQPLKNTDWQSSPNPQQPLNNTAWQTSPNPQHSVSPQEPLKNTYKLPLLQDKGGSKLSLTGAGEHWLIEEAERRRIAALDGKLQSGGSVGSRQSNLGPIKPARDSSNRWQGHTDFIHDKLTARGKTQNSISTPTPTGQTLLQPTAGVWRPHEQASYSASHSPHEQALYSASHSPHEQASYSASHSSDFPPEGKASGQTETSRASSQHPQQQQWSSPQFPDPQQQQWSSPQFPDPQQQQWSSPQFPDPQQQQWSSPQFPHPRQQTSAGCVIPTSQGQHNMPVTGSHSCSHCDQELGYGPAMVIESLELFFHVQCFRCWVCHSALGAGDHGADVRLRVNKLHCPNCYSNDEAGLKFSKV